MGGLQLWDLAAAAAGGVEPDGGGGGAVGSPFGIVVNEWCQGRSEVNTGRPGGLLPWVAGGLAGRTSSAGPCVCFARGGGRLDRDSREELGTHSL